MWRARDGLLAYGVGDPALEVLALLAPHLGHRETGLVHLLWRDVRRAVEDLAGRREEHRRRPATHVVAAVNVGPFVVVDADRHEALVDLLDDLARAVAGLIHH